MNKPILFHDIDGVLFGEYDGEFQLRPGVKTWLMWVHEHFDAVFLTTWTQAELTTLFSILYCEKFSASLKAPGFRSANWHDYVDKESWVVDAITKTGQREWFWIDDDMPTKERLEHLTLDPRRCLKVSPKGANELKALKVELLQLLSCS